MSFKIEQGLFSLDFTDYHAILGVPVDADAKDIRKRYLTIARRLHPDSCTTDNDVDRQRAANFLSKLVNPAYEKLSQEKNYVEYAVLLRLKGQQALRQQDTIALTSDAARRLASASDLETSYRAAIREVAEHQYQQLEQSLAYIGQISELNLVYLMRKESRGESIGLPQLDESINSSSAASRSSTVPSPLPKTPSAPPTRDSLISAYLRRAQEFETKQDFPRAIQELREALRMDATNSACHSRLGLIYLKTQQTTMAKIHFNKALELNPQDAVALEGKRKLEPSNSQKATKPDGKGAKPAFGKSDPKAKTPPRGALEAGEKPNSTGKGGLFRLFGNKKK
jgi:curved DNA-binding protein CbpA